MSAPPPLPGLTLERCVGSGSMGEVWRARDAEGCPVAVKLLRPSAEAERFVREVETLAAIEHPHVVRLLGAGREGERRWVVMELVEGGALQDLLAIGALGPEGLATVLAGVARGLHALHRLGIVHRDVKPGNVLLDERLAPRLVDFGLASFVDEVGRLTGSQEAVGTPHYMAPEVLDGVRPGPPADVWAVGMILLEGLHGRHPLADAPLPVALRRVREGRLPAPPAGTPPGLVAALRAALQRDPAARPTAGALALLLDAPQAAPRARSRADDTPPLAGSRSPARGEAIGPYVIERPLGSGAAASVFAARHAQLGTLRALKVLRRVNPAAAERFRREGELLARLPARAGLVRVHDRGALPDGRPWLAMDLVEGRTLREALTAGRLPVAQALTLGAGLARALGHVHREGIAHRDLKPENVLLDPRGAPTLVDFGVALDTAEDRLTRSQAVVGTLGYLAPEQAQADRRRVGPPADMFALGVLLYEASTGVRPFAAESPLQALAATLAGRARPLRELCPAAPADLERLLAALLERAPARRPTAQEAVEALEAIGRGEPWRPRRRARLPIGPLLLGALLALVAAAALSARRGPGALPSPASARPDAAPAPRRSGAETVEPGPELEQALAAAAGADLAGTSAALERARARDERAARAGIAAAVSAALVLPDPEAAARLIDTLDRAWPGSVQPAGAAPLVVRAARCDAQGDLEGALTAWNRVMDIDPSCTPPTALGVPTVVLLNGLGHRGELERLARVMIVAIRSGWPPGASLTRHYQAVAAGLREPPPGSAQRAPWAWDLLRAVAAEADCRAGGYGKAEQERVVRLNLDRLDAWILDPRVPAHGRANAEEITFELLDLLGQAEELEARVLALLADPGRARPPDWRCLHSVAAAWTHAGRPERARPWLLRALDVADAARPDLRRLDEPDLGRIKVIYSLALDVALSGPDHALGERLMAGERRSSLGPRLTLLHALLAEGRGDLAEARTRVEAFLGEEPRDEAARRLAARIAR